MTREEASIIIGNIPINGDGCYSISEYQRAKAMAIEALEQQPCEDCISRQAVLSYICNDLEFGDEENGCDLERKIAQEEIYNFVKKIPSVTPISKKKTGYWIDDADKIDAQFGKHTYKCSKCGNYAEYFVSGTEVWWDRIKPNFCPNCGVKMVEPQESEVNNG